MEMNNRSFYNAFNKDIFDSADLLKKMNKYVKRPKKWAAKPIISIEHFLVEKDLKSEGQWRVNIAIFRRMK